jgi:thiazole synthase
MHEKNRGARVAVVTVSCTGPPCYVVSRASETPMETLDITVNGKLRHVARGTTVAGLLAELGIDRARVAVERNRDIVPRATYDDVALAAGDRLELVGFVGGG